MQKIRIQDTIALRKGGIILKITDTYELQKIATEIRKHIIEQVYAAKSGHPGGSLSCADILTVLYFNQMNINEKEPNDMTRDRFVLSKGHCSPALYATLAQRGFFPKEELTTFRKLNSNLQGHPDRNKVAGVDMTTGSLGQGLSVANGMALSSKLNHDGYRVYCLLGDGETEEGQIWEAAMTACKYHLDNLCVILDYNGLQIDGTIEEVKGLNHIEEKWKSFGFHTMKVDGHNIEQLIHCFETAKMTKGKPSIILAKTIKGKGVPFMENKAEWHGKAPKEEEYKLALESLSKNENRKEG